MVLSELSIINYKNLIQADLVLSPKMNCFVGDNGMGKTNLLDAVYYLSFCRSYTNPVDSQIIRHGEEVCMLQGRYVFEDASREEIYCAMRRRQKKRFKRNRKEYERLSDHIGLIPLVMISPADNELITGGSEVRRRFMDMAVSQFDREYLRALLGYNKALLQRNVLLKGGEALSDATLMDLWEEQMAAAGTFIHRKRREFVEELTPIFNQFYAGISRSGERVSFGYVSQLSEADFRERLRNDRQRDFLLGHTSAGIHRDELEMLLDDYPVKRVGSQGQNKTFFVSLKLAQFRFLLKTGGVKPLLLLDDIFDRLDAGRVGEIVKLVSGPEFGQIFISDTNRGSLDGILARIDSRAQIFSVANGVINPVKV
ncbi:MAG: DNA replication and repair protein RecF [Proteiniphilum sp.]|jgi:DNA replication and repair protein RecF|nr:DNA replication and repair protein RecF [Proteiniphilum sp.]